MDVLAVLMTIGVAVIGFVVSVWLLLRILGVRVIRSDQVGIVEKWWSPKGSLKDAIIALHGEAGYQPEVLRGGIHFRSPFMYRVRVMPLITIPQGKIGYVFARDGEPLPPEQTLGHVVECANFQDVRAFIAATAATSAARSARSCARARTRSTSRSSSSSPSHTSTTCRWAARRRRRRSCRWPPTSPTSAASHRSSSRAPRTRSASSPCTTGRRCPWATSSPRRSATTPPSPTTTATSRTSRRS